MPKVILILLFSFALIACDSPRNNRVTGDKESNLQLMNFKHYKLKITAQWLEGPIGKLSFHNELLVIIKDSSGNFVDLPEGLTLGFYATMPSMGHPMEDAGYFKRLGTGVYVNQHIRYNMSGDWRNELWVLDSDFNIMDKVIWDEFF